MLYRKSLLTNLLTNVSGATPDKDPMKKIPYRTFVDDLFTKGSLFFIIIGIIILLKILT